MTADKQREHLRHLERIFWIDYEIRAGRYPNNGQIAAHFEISEKTAQRTMEFLRDRLKMPVGYNAEERGWYYTEPAWALPAIELIEGDLIAILLAEKLSRQYRGTAIGQQVAQAFSKVLEAMTNTITIDLKALAEAHSFEAAATSELDSKLFAQLGRAVRERQQIRMRYYTAMRNEEKWRTVNPLHLRNHLGDWYLVAWDHGRQQPLDFHCGRIRELEALAVSFEWPEGFDLKAYLDTGFGMIRGQAPIQVELLFDEYQSRWMRERGKFHATEAREELPDGRMRMQMTVTALDGVKRFVMQYGSHVTVIAPDELRKAIREEIEMMQRLYAGGENER
jgi:predicted DNA-binding transcriptional regulator YafY